MYLANRKLYIWTLCQLVSLGLMFAPSPRCRPASSIRTDQDCSVSSRRSNTYKLYRAEIKTVTGFQSDIATFFFRERKLPNFISLFFLQLMLFPPKVYSWYFRGHSFGFTVYFL